MSNAYENVNQFGHTVYPLKSEGLINDQFQVIVSETSRGNNELAIVLIAKTKTEPHFELKQKFLIFW